MQQLSFIASKSLHTLKLLLTAAEQALLHYNCMITSQGGGACMNCISAFIVVQYLNLVC